MRLDAGTFRAIEVGASPPKTLQAGLQPTQYVIFNHEMAMQRKTSKLPKLRRLTVLLSILALGASFTLAACGGDEPQSSPPPDYEKALSGAPPELAAIYDQANQLLDGGKEAYEKQIEDLRGTPIVVNVWASWCGPCRAEFPQFQQVSAQLGKEVAFLAIDAEDSDDAAETFLRDNPVPYPSFTDPDKKIAIELVQPYSLPATIFYDRKGRHFVKHGFYATDEQLIADIEQHALGTS